MPEIENQPGELPEEIRLTKRVPGEAAERFRLIQVQVGHACELTTLLIEKGRVQGFSRCTTEAYDTLNEALVAREEMLSRLKRDGYAECPGGEEK